MLLVLLLIAGTGPVAAQPRSAPEPLRPVESVVVTGTKSGEALQDFVGARVNGDPKCRPNIQIVFTTTPQELVNDIRKRHGNLLGYYDSITQLDSLSIFRGPVQAWYMTGTRDVRGHLQIDTARTEGMDLLTAKGWDIPMVVLPNARAYAVTGNRLGDGLRANLHLVTIIADPTKLLDHEMGRVADYIAMLALSQIVTPERCQSLPTITNLLAAACPRIPEGLSDIDLGYLRGLYHMNAASSKSVQIREVTYQMRQELIGAEAR